MRPYSSGSLPYVCPYTHICAYVHTRGYKRQKKKKAGIYSVKSRQVWIYTPTINTTIQIVTIELSIREFISDRENSKKFNDSKSSFSPSRPPTSKTRNLSFRQMNFSSFFFLFLFIYFPQCGFSNVARPVFTGV